MGRNIQKVAGHTNLIRRASAPGALINTNTNGYNAFISARKKAQEVEDLKDELAILREAVMNLQESSK